MYIFLTCLFTLSKLVPSLKSPRLSPFFSYGAAKRNKASIFFGNLFSDKYLAKNIPPSEWPIKITLLSSTLVTASKYNYHSSYRAYEALGILGFNTS